MQGNTVPRAHDQDVVPAITVDISHRCDGRVARCLPGRRVRKIVLRVVGIGEADRGAVAGRGTPDIDTARYRATASGHEHGIYRRGVVADGLQHQEVCQAVAIEIADGMHPGEVFVIDAGRACEPDAAHRIDSERRCIPITLAEDDLRVQLLCRWLRLSIRIEIEHRLVKPVIETIAVEVPDRPDMQRLATEIDRLAVGRRVWRERLGRAIRCTVDNVVSGRL